MSNTNGGKSRRHADQQNAQSRAQRLSRALGISIFYHICYEIRHRGPSVAEPKKIAITQDFWMALLSGSVHFVPIAAAFVLVILNWRGYYIGGELEGAVGQDDAKFIGLQFAAKLHELTITASLTAVIFSYIRHELVTDSGLPFGAVMAGLQFKEISYLWSMEFWGVVRANWRRWQDKTGLILLIIVCTGLSLSAGPSSATLMRPRLDWWPAGGSDFWVALPQDVLYSTNASASQIPMNCTTEIDDLSCPSSGWQTLAQNYMLSYQFIQRNGPFGYLPDTVQVPGAKAVRDLRASNRSPNFQFSTPMTTASVGSSSIADALVEMGRLWAWSAYNCGSSFHERFWSRLDVTYRVLAQQPLVSARCLVVNNVSDTGLIEVFDLWDQNHNDENGDFSTIVIDYTQDRQMRSMMQGFNTSTVTEVVWATVPQLNGSTLAAFLAVPLPQNNSKLFSCTLDARIAPGYLQGTRDEPLIVTGADHFSTYDFNNTLPRISIDPDWAGYLNPVISSDNSTAFQNILRAAGLCNMNTYTDHDNLVAIVESLFALTVVNGLARRDYGVGFLGTLSGNIDGLYLVSNRNLSDTADQESICEDWSKQLLPSVSHGMGPGGNAFNISDHDKKTGVKFNMQAQAQGWAYSASGSAAKYAIFALLLYVLIAAGHWAYSLKDQKTSSSWDSISELVALALRSDQSDAFVDTGAGIFSAAIFRKPSQVIDKDGRLQLAVGHPEGSYEMVEPNKYYG